MERIIYDRAIGRDTKAEHEGAFHQSRRRRFKKRRDDIKRSDLRHYNQIVTQFNDSVIRFALSKFKIPIETRVTIYGGFTGQFAKSLMKVGMRVIFTDPMDEWVEQAKEAGFESFKFSVQEMPQELVERTDLFASFECYPDLIGESEFYFPIMRFLTVQYGILFAESKGTVTSMRKEDPRISQELGTFRRWFRPLYRVYGIQLKAVKTKHLNFYHLFAAREKRKVLAVDCLVMKIVHNNFEFDHRVGAADVSTLATQANLDKQTIELSIGRLRKLSDSINAPFLKSLPFMASTIKGSLHIGSKRFFFVSE